MVIREFLWGVCVLRFVTASRWEPAIPINHECIFAGLFAEYVLTQMKSLAEI